MVDITTAQTPNDFIEAVRSTFRTYVPESDAWAEPNFFSINSTIIGGLIWSAWNEARNGFDARINPQTAEGEYLDILASLPPLNLTRYTPTQSTGFVMANLPALSSVPAGYQFTAADGTVYTATGTTALVAGVGSVPVISSGSGLAVNSANNRPLQAADGTATSLGIYGGNDTETDDAFRQRIFSAQQMNAGFFGSACSYENALLTIPGVSRGWAINDGLVSKIVFLMEGKTPCGAPTDQDIADVEAFFSDACYTNLYSCLTFEGAQSLTIHPPLKYEGANCPDDMCEIEAALTDWLRENYTLGEGVRGSDIECYLRMAFPDYLPYIDCCFDYPAVPCAVYNCVDLVGG